MTITATKATAHKAIGTDKEGWEGSYKIKGATDEAQLEEFFQQFDRYLLKKTGQSTLDPQEDDED
jgi:hypothetical protein